MKIVVSSKDQSLTRDGTTQKLGIRVLDVLYCQIPTVGELPVTKEMFDSMTVGGTYDLTITPVEV